MIAASGSRSGKTVLTAALARRWSNQGKRVQVFKIGPDFLDSMILELGSRRTVYNLDLWMMGQDHCQQLLSGAARDNDIILVESLMGLHDNQPSSAELAGLFGIPVTLVLNVAKYAQTAAAIAEGMANYGAGAEITEVVGNLVGSDNHHRLMGESIGELYSGSVRRDDRLVLPERHLGLVQAGEIRGLDKMLDDAAQALDEYEIHISPKSVDFECRDAPSLPKTLEGKTIAIARDAAFSFIYTANTELLKAMGAGLVYFSPLANDALPECDALWVPGGYPELHLEALTHSDRTRKSIISHQKSAKPILAECGGMMYLCDRITAVNGKTGKGCGLLDAKCVMHKRFQGLGPEMVDYGNGVIRGHTFHHSTVLTDIRPSTGALRQNGSEGEAVYRSGRSTMSYLHHYFPSNPLASVKLIY
jgi:cobyrinic acid a,c-diamide synthase